MGCRCNPGSAAGQPWQNAPPAFPKPPKKPKPPKAPPRARFNQEGFCKTCGWLLKQITVYDPRTGSMVKRNVCTNSRCGAGR